MIKYLVSTIHIALVTVTIHISQAFEWQGLTGGKRAKSKSPEPVLAELKTEITSSLGEGVLEAMTSEVDEILANGSESDYSSPTG